MSRPRASSRGRDSRSAGTGLAAGRFIQQQTPDSRIEGVRSRWLRGAAPGVAEDPATGSANCTLGGLLAHHEQVTNGMFSWRIAQGVEMGRPSTLVARAEKKDGEVTGTWIGGAAVLVSEGTIHLD